jgi:hypothetical protein
LRIVLPWNGNCEPNCNKIDLSLKSFIFTLKERENVSVIGFGAMARFWGQIILLKTITTIEADTTQITAMVMTHIQLI